MTKIHNQPDLATGRPAHSDDARRRTERTEVYIVFPRPSVGIIQPRDPYDLGWLFLCWCWESRFPSWTEGLRALARTLRGLEAIGLIERRRIRRGGRPTHHGFVLTDEGREAVVALSGDWIEEDQR